MSTQTVLQGDCLEVMKTFPDKSFDLVLTDPPYGLNSRMQGGTWGENAIYKEMRGQEGWDVLITKEYFDEMFRVSKEQVIWGGNYYTMPPSRCWFAWEKNEKMETLADFELAWTSLDKPAKMFKERRNPDGKRQHPTQKPLELMRWCLSQFPDAQKILDPFMGSGTTLVAAKYLNRNATGIEISEKYCEIARKRLSQEQLF